MLSRRTVLAACPALWIGTTLAAEPLPVVASFSILADIARQIGGSRVAVTSIVGPDQDAHVYEPTPADAKTLLAAKLFIINGLGFESWAERLARASAFKGIQVVAGEAITALEEEGDHGHGHGKDPHAWQDVANVKAYAAVIAKGLAKADPEGAAIYDANLQTYRATLDRLDGDIRAMFAAVPVKKRKILTSHDAFAYFGKAYGISFLSPQGKSTASEASAKTIARLVQQIKKEGIRALFLEKGANSKVLEQIARETNITIGGTLFADALTAQAPTYEAMMRHNAKVLSDAIK